MNLYVPFLVIGLIGCASNDLSVHHSRDNKVDVVIIPGCPTNNDGGLSDCLQRRVIWGANIWKRQLTKNFITSGAATHNPFIEAEAIAAGLLALGVPARVVWLEPNARHTDENVFYALDIARRLGFRTLAVASDSSHASGGCSFLESWDQPCLEAAVDEELVQSLDQHRQLLADVRVRPVPADLWLHVDAYEQQREDSGGRSRPRSAILYPWSAVRRLFGAPWIPVAPPDEPPVRYSEWLAAGQ